MNDIKGLDEWLTREYSGTCYSSHETEDEECYYDYEDYYDEYED